MNDEGSVLVPEVLPGWGIPLTRDLAFLIGFLSGKLRRATHVFRMPLQRQRRYWAIPVAQMFSELVGVEVIVRASGTKLVIETDDIRALDFIETVCPTTGIHQSIKTAPQEVRVGFVEGIFGSRGKLTYYGITNPVSENISRGTRFGAVFRVFFNFKDTNEGLANDLVDLLRSLGVLAFVVKAERSRSGRLLKVHIQSVKHVLRLFELLERVNPELEDWIRAYGFRRKEEEVPDEF